MASKNETPLTRAQVWLLAARPRTLPAAAAPVIVGSALAYRDGFLQPWLALAALLTALLLQIGANLANDVFDYYRGADTPERLGPLRMTQAGLLTPGQVLAGMWLIFGLAALLGLYLAYAAGWVVILLGICAILAALAYTGGPFPYGYYGLGDLSVFLFFGVAAVMGTYYVQAKAVSALSLWSSLPMGFLITAILVVNNLRDIRTDRQAGKKTLAVRLGESSTRREYLLCLVGAYSVPVVTSAIGLTYWWVLLSWLSIPLAFYWAREVFRQQGRPLNRALAGTGQLVLVYAILFSLGLVLPVVVLI
jgi:1,4-dihydroxy-2-naphthoate polyprenyltransferase